jgi:hypothetical protein
MARKPVNLERKNKKAGSRQEIWEEIRKQKVFTLKSLEWAIADSNKGTIRSYVKSLEKAGFVAIKSIIPIPPFAVGEYKLIKDVGVHAPRVNKKGEIVKQGFATEQMWRAMKMLPQFTIAELAAIASTNECEVKVSHAQYYVKCLAKAGYLTREGKQNEAGIYRLIPIRYTGFLPPMIQRLKTVFDPNLNKIMWQEEIDE